MKRRFCKIYYRCCENQDISLDELRQKRANGAVIIDVRNVREYNEGHLAGSINIPEYEINKNFTNIFRNKNITIVLYCSSGYRSKEAYRKIKNMGYSNVYNLRGGLDNN